MKPDIRLFKQASQKSIFESMFNCEISYPQQNKVIQMQDVRVYMYMQGLVNVLVVARL